jgi:glutamate synthase (NADPH/NADH) small chain
VPGRDLDGVHFAMSFAQPEQGQRGRGSRNQLRADGKHVIVIGGGDTGNDRGHQQPSRRSQRDSLN